MKQFEVTIVVCAVSSMFWTNCQSASANHVWQGWKLGSSITFSRYRVDDGKPSTETATWTLRKSDKDYAEVEETIQGKKTVQPFTVYSEGILPKIGFAASKPVKTCEESITVDGKQYKCDVFRHSTSWFPPCGNDETRSVESEILEWKMHDAPDVLVQSKTKSTTYFKDKKVPPKVDPVAAEVRLVHYQTPVVVDKQKLTCNIYETIEPERNTKTIEWQCKSVPLGFTKMQCKYSKAACSEYTETLLRINRK